MVRRRALLAPGRGRLARGRPGRGKLAPTNHIFYVSPNTAFLIQEHAGGGFDFKIVEPHGTRAAQRNDQVPLCGLR